MALVLSCSLAACTYHVDSAIPETAASFEPRLVGTWESESDTVVVTASEGSSYRIDWRDSEGGPVVFHGRTGRLGDRTVLEITPYVGGEPSQWPVGRLLMVLTVTDAEVRTWMLHPDSLRARASGGAAPIPYIASGDDDIVLTAPTAQLAPALAAHIRRPGVLKTGDRWRRVK
jgi:hypothetical protein